MFSTKRDTGQWEGRDFLQFSHIFCLFLFAYYLIIHLYIGTVQYLWPIASVFRLRRCFTRVLGTFQPRIPTGQFPTPLLRPRPGPVYWIGHEGKIPNLASREMNEYSIFKGKRKRNRPKEDLIVPQSTTPEGGVRMIRVFVQCKVAKLASLFNCNRENCNR